MNTEAVADAGEFRRQGYCVCRNLLEDDEIRMLRGICDELLREPPDDDKGGTAHDIGRGHDRRFLRHRHLDFEGLRDFVLGAQMKGFMSSFVGETPHLFNEQFVVKGARTGSAFAWHQDGGYIPFAHRPYASLWIALDDTTVDNGALWLLARGPEDGDVPREHVWSEVGKEYVGYDGPDPGKPAEVSAGSAVVFTSLTLHRSSPNTTDRRRRSYLAQYSPEPILDPSTGMNRQFATPL